MMVSDTRFQVQTAEVNFQTRSGAIQKDPVGGRKEGRWIWRRIVRKAHRKKASLI